MPLAGSRSQVHAHVDQGLEAEQHREPGDRKREKASSMRWRERSARMTTKAKSAEQHEAER